MASATPTTTNQSVFSSYGLPIGNARILALLTILKECTRHDKLAVIPPDSAALAREIHQLLACSIYDPADSQRIIATRLAALFELLSSDPSECLERANKQLESWWTQDTLIAPAVLLPIPDNVSPLTDIENADQNWSQLLAKLQFNLQTDFRRVRQLLHLMITEANAYDVPRRRTVSDHTETLLLAGIIGIPEDANMIDFMTHEAQLAEFCKDHRCLHMLYICIYIAMIAKVTAGAADCIPILLYVPPVAIGRRHGRSEVPYIWCTKTEIGFVHPTVRYRIPACQYKLFILNVDCILNSS